MGVLQNGRYIMGNFTKMGDLGVIHIYHIYHIYHKPWSSGQRILSFFSTSQGPAQVQLRCHEGPGLGVGVVPLDAPGHGRRRQLRGSLPAGGAGDRQGSSERFHTFLRQWKIL